MDAKLQELCRQAHEDRIRVGMLDTDTKNRTLELAADALMAHEQEILEANAIDMERGSDVHAKTAERTDHWKSACSHRCRWHYL